jgi:hypothetical protein
MEAFLETATPDQPVPNDSSEGSPGSTVIANGG